MRIVKTSNLSFFQLKNIVNYYTGRMAIKDFIGANIGRHKDSTGEYGRFSGSKLIHHYERGKVVVVDFSPQSPLFKYIHLPNNKGYWEYRKTGQRLIDIRLENHARIVRPPARIEPSRGLEDVKPFGTGYIPEPKKCDKKILDAYFAKEIEEEVEDGTESYQFKGDTSLTKRASIINIIKRLINIEKAPQTTSFSAIDTLLSDSILPAGSIVVCPLSNNTNAEYRLRNSNDVRKNIPIKGKKDSISKIIYGREKSKYGDRYPTEASIKESLTQNSYSAGDTIVFKVFKKEKVLKKIEKATLGSKVYLVAKTKKFNAGDKITFKIYEKDKLILDDSSELPVLVKNQEKTVIEATMKIDYVTKNIVVEEIELRPKKDKKSNDEDKSENLENWKKKFKKAEGETENKEDKLYLKVDSDACGDIKEKEFLVGKELVVNAIDCTKLTLDNLKNIDKHTSLVNRKKHLDGLNNGMKLFEINTCLRVAHFLAQVLHESAHLSAVKELGGKNYLKKKSYYPYYGRGLMQLTWDTNFKAYGKFVGVDTYTYIKSTDDTTCLDLIKKAPHSAQSACWFWTKSKKLNDEADKNDFFAITYKINGGFNGIDERFENLENFAEEFNLDFSTDYLFKDSWIYKSSKASLAWGIWHDPLIKSLGGNITGCTKDNAKAKEGYKRVTELISATSTKYNDYSLQKHVELNSYKDANNRVYRYKFAKKRMEEL